MSNKLELAVKINNCNIFLKNKMLIISTKFEIIHFFDD